MNPTQIWKYENDDVLADRIFYPTPSARDFFVHSHSRWEFLFVHTGSVRYQIGSEIFRLHPGDLVMIRPGQNHCLLIDSDAAYERTDLILPHSLLTDGLPAFLPENLSVLRFSEEEEKTSVFARLSLYSERYSEPEFASLFPNLVTELQLSIRSVAEKEKTQLPPTVRNALEYIDTHLTDLSDLNELCAHLFITKSHLHHVFHNCLHTTPKQYILSRRLFLANRSIHSGIRPTVAAAKCGFGDYSAFYRAYKKAFGHAPGSSAGAPVAEENPT